MIIGDVKIQPKEKLGVIGGHNNNFRWIDSLCVDYLQA